MRARKSYGAGMNKDLTSDKRPEDGYYNLENFRVVTEEGLTTGSLTNESSTVSKFIIPDLDEMTLTDGTVIPAQAGNKIIGWTTMIDTLIIFTTNSDDEEPSSYGQIWTCVFDETTGEVENITEDGELDPDYHLIYNQFLNFSTYHRIGRAVARYENAETQGVYWTDNYNAVRTFNIAVEDSLNIPIDNVDLIASVNFAQPVISDIGTGNLRTQAMIQFAYRLSTTGGAATVLSPASRLVPLTEASIESVTWEQFTVSMFDNQGGADTQTRSVTYTINGIDTDWDVIEHVAIVYTDLDVFNVYVFDEEIVPATGEITVICSDLDNALQMTTLEYNIVSSGFDIAKDLVSKHNRLIAANTSTTSFIVDYDARAYRFNDDQEGLLTDADDGDITLDGTNPDYTDVPDEYDAINPYNDESTVGWDNNSQYKYQANGSTIGGSGANISYSFVSKEFLSTTTGEFDHTTTPPHLDLDSWSDSTPVDTLGVYNYDGTLMEFPKANYLPNFAGPQAHSVYTGYARGEVYRFGIVFYGASGSITFVNWIADIKMPEPDDGFPTMDYEDGGSLSNESYSYLYSLGVEFNVDISSISDQITGYSIVRVKREPADRTRLGTGMQNWFDGNNDDTTNSLIHHFEAGNTDDVAQGDPWPTTTVLIVGTQELDGYVLPQFPGWKVTQSNSQSARRACFLHSPLTQSVSYQFKEEDFIKTYSYYSAPPIQYYDTDNTGADNNKDYGFSFLLENYVPASTVHSTQRFQIKTAHGLRTGEFIKGNNAFLDGVTSSVYGLANASIARSGGNDKNIPLGIGNAKLAIILTDTDDITINGATDPMTGDYAGGTPVQNVGAFDNDLSYGHMYFREVAMCRHILNQYSGNTYEDRSTNQYISTGHYQISSDDVDTNLSPSIYGGDVYVNLLDDEYIEPYIIPSAVFGGVYEKQEKNWLSMVVMHPTETVVNQDYRMGKRWFSHRIATEEGLGNYQTNSYAYKAVFSQQDTAKDLFYAEDFLSNTVEEHPNQMWASEAKVDGEFYDSWRIFQVNNSINVSGVYGSINRIMSFKDKIYFYQDSAIGITTIDERVVLGDDSGQELTIGQGGVFPDFKYISTVTGSTHQFSVINTEHFIYHWDARIKKIYKTSQDGAVPISDVNGMSSYFHNLSGDMLTQDITLRSDDEGRPVGVHAVADYRYNRVLFTFLDPSYEDVDKGVGFTVSFNEMLNAFEGFYSFTPSLYLQYGRRLLSTTPLDLNEAWEHNTSEERGQFYNTIYASTIDTILASGGSTTKVFDTLQWQGTVTDSDGEDVEETFEILRVYNEYQDTGTIALTVDDNIKRHLRLWRTLVPRDVADNDPRIRAPWTHLYMSYPNWDQHKITVKDIEYSFRPSKN